MINEYINELVAYGLNQGLVDPEDEVYVTNRLLELFQLTEHEGTAKEVRSERELSQILNDMLEYACRQGMLTVSCLVGVNTQMKKHLFMCLQKCWNAQVFTKEHRKDKLPSKNFWSAYKKRTISHL